MIDFATKTLRYLRDAILEAKKKLEGLRAASLHSARPEERCRRC